MSGAPRNARELLKRQVDEMGSIRNANPRDPQFKQWRQNTLTVIQRIWPGDTSRSERFSRVPFTPPSSKPDARAAREYFERGCGEALEFLNQLIRQVDDPAQAPKVDASRGSDVADTFEGDYPTLELGGADSPPAPAKAVNAPPPPKAGSAPPPLKAEPAPAPEKVERSAGPPRVPGLAPSAPSSDSRPLEITANIVPDEPAATAKPPAPHSRVSVRRPGAHDNEGESAEKLNPLRDIFADVQVPPPAEPRRRGKKGSGRQRLKDMLGLQDLEPGARGSASASRRTEKEPRPEPAPPRIEPAASRTPAPAPAPAPAEFVLPEFLVPPEAPASLTPADLDVAVPAPEAPPAAASAPISVPASPARVEPEAPAMPAAPVASPAPPPAHEPEAPAEDDAARVTAEFLLNSPVLSSQPRPVARRVVKHESSARESSLAGRDTASRLMQIASEVDALGVPAGQRAWARASLMDLSRLVETGEVSWDSLRDAVQFAMQFPPLARRVLPLLLPFLDLAA